MDIVKCFYLWYFRYKQNNVLKIEIIFPGENTNELLYEWWQIHHLSAAA